MLDLIVRGGTLPDGRGPLDIACQDGRIVEVAPRVQGEAGQELDARGQLVTPPFIDSHFHMDATLSAGQPRHNRSGTLLEGIEIWADLKLSLSADNIKARARELCQWAIAKGNLAIRSHVDICDPALTAVDALLDIKREMAPYLDLQLVAFPQDGLLRSPGAEQQLLAALDRGVEVVGGIPHFERTMAEGAESIRRLCEIAAERGLAVDMHCDESDDPWSRHIETLVFETQRLGLQGRVTGSHLTSMHSMDNYYVSKLLPLMAEAQVHAVANPLINITLQGRHDSYPKRRGLTRIREMLEHGITVALGHDCVMDPWYAMGSHDMLEVAHMAVHVGQLTGMTERQAMFRAITEDAARVLELPGYGLASGCHADLVVLQASDVLEALRLRPPRSYVVRRGRVIAETPRLSTTVHLQERDTTVDFRR